MRPLIILLVATTTLLCSYASGVDVEHSAAFERVAECIYICTHADNADENLPVETVICDAHKVRVRLSFSGTWKTRINVKCNFDEFCTLFYIL